MWEYDTVPLHMMGDEEQLEFLNEMGEADWELITVTTHVNDEFPTTAYFKRPKAAAPKGSDNHD